MKFNILTSIIIVGFAVTTGCEQRNGYAYDDWDEDSNNVIDNDEFDARWNEIGYYGTWDADADGAINEEEWETGINDNYTNYNNDAHGNYEDWDRNRDGMLDEQEFREGNYSLWDNNNDGNIQDNEYQEWYYDV